jgi:hypothetical protein
MILLLDPLRSWQNILPGRVSPSRIISDIISLMLIANNL